MTTGILKRENGTTSMPATSFGGLVDQLFQNNLNRFFEDDTWGFRGLKQNTNVPANVQETDKTYELQLVVPGVKKEDFNSYGSRRGNDEVMVRGTFANVRIKNKLATKEGGYTQYLPTGEELSVYEASVKYKENHTPLLVLAGKEYGSGSSRDWAAKGTFMLGIKAVLAESYERILYFML